MKRQVAFVLLTTLVLVSAVGVAAQETNNAAQRLDELRTQLSSLQEKEAELKIRLEELNFDLKPENIERHFNGFGSTRPEELREARRRQLQTEKDWVTAQLEQLATSRLRLEGSITSAQADVYNQSAIGAAMLQDKQDGGRFRTFTGMLIASALLVIVVGSLGWRLMTRRRRNF